MRHRRVRSVAHSGPRRRSRDGGVRPPRRPQPERSHGRRDQQLPGRPLRPGRGAVGDRRARHRRVGVPGVQQREVPVEHRAGVARRPLGVELVARDRLAPAEALHARVPVGVGHLDAADLGERRVDLLVVQLGHPHRAAGPVDRAQPGLETAVRERLGQPGRDAARDQLSAQAHPDHRGLPAPRALQQLGDVGQRAHGGGVAGERGGLPAREQVHRCRELRRSERTAAVGHHPDPCPERAQRCGEPRAVAEPRQRLAVGLPHDHVRCRHPASRRSPPTRSTRLVTTVPEPALRRRCERREICVTGAAERQGRRGIASAGSAFRPWGRRAPASRLAGRRAWPSEEAR